MPPSSCRGAWQSRHFVPGTQQLGVASSSSHRCRTPLCSSRLACGVPTGPQAGLAVLSPCRDSAWGPRPQEAAARPCIAGDACGIGVIYIGRCWPDASIGACAVWVFVERLWWSSPAGHLEATRGLAGSVCPLCVACCRRCTLVRAMAWGVAQGFWNRAG